MLIKEGPKPDPMLEQIEEAEDKPKKRGKLKIFFGYAAGVGKTYAMLQAAHLAKESGVDVVAGYIEPHTRPETIKLLEGLEILEPLQINYRGITLNEFDLDRAMERSPGLILVDELAHTNAQGCRHLKRYQDIEELLKAGIDVYTSINVQHIESLNDIVAAITGVVVRERIPDRVFDGADLVELVDIEPDDLIERLHKGEIYSEQQAKRALKNFFIKQNLVALREIALRRTADQVNQVVEKNKALDQNAEYYTSEHILICLSSSPSNSKVIRTAARMANAFHGNFTALFVETTQTKEMTEENKIRLHAHLKLAEQLGAKIVTVDGEDVPTQIAEYAKVSSVSKIILGRSNNKKGIIPKPSFVERLTALAPNIDIYIIPDRLPAYREEKMHKLRAVSKISTKDTIKTLGIFALVTAISWGFSYLGFSEANIITVYILGVLFTSVCTEGKFYSILMSCVSVLTFNFFFTIPLYSFEAYGANYPVTFLVMFIAAVLTSTLTMRVKEQGRHAALKTQRMEVLLETSQRLQRAETKEQIYTEMAHQMRRLLNRTIIIYPIQDKSISEEPLIFMQEGDMVDPNLYTTKSERVVAEWVYKNNKHAGATTNTLPGAKCIYLAVRSNDIVFAVVAIAIEKSNSIDSFERSLLIAMLSEFGITLEKHAVIESKNLIALKAQREQLRTNLLRAISHDLRTPLTGICGNAGILMEKSELLDQGKKVQLYTDIYDDSMWLINLVENLLSVTRIENDAMNIPMQGEILDEVIGEALRHINRKSSEHTISVDVADELLMAKMDSRLIIQVLINLIDNAIKYTPIHSHIGISARKINTKIRIEVSDDGIGISDEIKKKLFDMFFTLETNKGDSRRGMGLGLPLCQSIVNAHGGELIIRDNIPHGTIFGFELEAEEVDFGE